MTSLPSPTKVAGNHVLIYETYYNLVDPNNHGRIGAMDAAKFLKKSHLSDVILSKIWDMADPSSRGFLDKPGMYVALKLCALAQQGHNLSIPNIYVDIPPPKMGDIYNATKIISCPQNTNAVISESCWSINPLERAKYEQLFRSLEPVNGYIPGNKVKGVLIDSKLPLETLGKIWDLADIDKDGKLNQHEFVVAMHLVYKALEKNAVPNVLPTELMDSSINVNVIDQTSKLQASPVPTSEPALFNTPSTFTKDVKTNEWVVSYEDHQAAEKLFAQADEDRDGFVSGAEIKDVFFQSGLSQSILAHIWSLCDISQTGKLNTEQFALSMWLIKQKLNGIDLPTKLSSEMIPPSFRKRSSECIIENNNVCSFSNPELDMINKDINEIIHEKHAIEQDISQKEADIKIKSGEIKSLQSELDTLAATLRQLDNQKGEAQKRLNDLKTQVDKLQQQAMDQESTLHVQEGDLNNKRQEIECLKLAEQNLETQQQEYKNQLNSLSKQLQNIQLQISQTKASMTQLEEQQRQILDVITQYDAAFAVGDASVVPDASLLFKAKLEGSTYNINKLNDITNRKTVDSENKKDFYNNNKELNDTDQRYDVDPFQKDIHSETENQSFSADPFYAKDKKAFDPFTDGFTKSNASNLTQVKDPFGEDPFAALHAPIRSESPSPALPPKKSKQPPPRPAPPRPAQGPHGLLRTSTSSPTTSAVTTSDPFADKINNITSNTFDFADFANFDPKDI